MFTNKRWPELAGASPGQVLALNYSWQAHQGRDDEAPLTKKTHCFAAVTSGARLDSALPDSPGLAGSAFTVESSRVESLLSVRREQKIGRRLFSVTWGRWSEKNHLAGSLSAEGCVSDEPLPTCEKNEVTSCRYIFDAAPDYCLVGS